MDEKALLGLHGRDAVSGFEGTVTAVCMYKHGVTAVRLTAASSEGKVPEEYWIDQPRLVLVQ